MERYRIVYHNTEGVSSEATIDAEEGNEAVAQIEDMGRLLSIQALSDDAPKYEGATPDTAVNEGDARPLSLREFPDKLPYKGEDGTSEDEKAKQGPDPFPEEETPEGGADPDLPEAHEPETMPKPGFSNSEMEGPDPNKPGEADLTKNETEESGSHS